MFLRRFLIVAAAVMAFAGVLLSAMSPSSPLKVMLFGRPLIIERPPLATARPNYAIFKIGHRGTTIFAPENTLPAFEKAIEMGLEYVEIDVRFTSDGVPVLLHDGTVDRTTNGSGKVSELTLSDLQKLDAGSWFADEFIGTQIPTLEEALKLLQGRMCILWDTKELPDKAVLELFRRYGFNRDCLLIGIGWPESGRTLEKARQIVEYWPDAPMVPTVKTQEELAAILQDFPNLRAVLVNRTHLDRQIIDAAHAEGLLVITSSLGQSDRAQTYKNLIELGTDMFMLDYVDSFYTYLETGNTDTPIPKPPKNAEYLQNKPE